MRSGRRITIGLVGLVLLVVLVWLIRDLSGHRASPGSADGYHVYPAATVGSQYLEPIDRMVTWQR